MSPIYIVLAVFTVLRIIGACTPKPPPQETTAKKPRAPGDAVAAGTVLTTQNIPSEIDADDPQRVEYIRVLQSSNKSF